MSHLQSVTGKQSFWLMNNDARKGHKLPGCFDRELFDSLDKCLEKSSCSGTEIIFDSGRVDEGLFSDTEHALAYQIPVIHEKEVVESPMPMESPPMESGIPTPGACETKFNDEKFSLMPCEEKPALHATGRQKRKRLSNVGSSAGECDDFKSQLCSMLESSSRVLTAHVESQNLNRQLDRNQRKEHAESLVGVLGKLADALGKIAERL